MLPDASTLRACLFSIILGIVIGSVTMHWPFGRKPAREGMNETSSATQSELLTRIYDFKEGFATSDVYLVASTESSLHDMVLTELNRARLSYYIITDQTSHESIATHFRRDRWGILLFSQGIFRNEAILNRFRFAFEGRSSHLPGFRFLSLLEVPEGISSGCPDKECVSSRAVEGWTYDALRSRLSKVWML